MKNLCKRTGSALLALAMVFSLLSIGSNAAYAEEPIVASISADLSDVLLTLSWDAPEDSDSYQYTVECQYLQNGESLASTTFSDIHENRLTQPLSSPFDGSELTAGDTAVLSITVYAIPDGGEPVALGSTFIDLKGPDTTDVSYTLEMLDAPETITPSEIDVFSFQVTKTVWDNDEPISTIMEPEEYIIEVYTDCEDADASLVDNRTAQLTISKENSLEEGDAVNVTIIAEDPDENYLCEYEADIIYLPSNECEHDYVFVSDSATLTGAGSRITQCSKCGDQITEYSSSLIAREFAMVQQAFGSNYFAETAAPKAGPVSAFLALDQYGSTAEGSTIASAEYLAAARSAFQKLPDMTKSPAYQSASDSYIISREDPDYRDYVAFDSCAYENGHYVAYGHWLLFVEDGMDVPDDAEVTEINGEQWIVSSNVKLVLNVDAENKMQVVAYSLYTPSTDNDDNLQDIPNFSTSITNGILDVSWSEYPGATGYTILSELLVDDETMYEKTVGSENERSANFSLNLLQLAEEFDDGPHDFLFVVTVTAYDGNNAVAESYKEFYNVFDGLSYLDLNNCYANEEYTCLHISREQFLEDDFVTELNTLAPAYLNNTCTKVINPRYYDLYVLWFDGADTHYIKYEDIDESTIASIDTYDAWNTVHLIAYGNAEKGSTGELPIAVLKVYESNDINLLVGDGMLAPDMVSLQGIEYIAGQGINWTGAAFAPEFTLTDPNTGDVYTEKDCTIAYYTFDWTQLSGAPSETSSDPYIMSIRLTGHDEYTGSIDRYFRIDNCTHEKIDTEQTDIVPATASRDGSCKLLQVCHTCHKTLGYANNGTKQVIPSVDTTVLSKTSYYYSGSVRKPTVTVTDRTGSALVLNQDFKVVYPAGMINAGTYSVTVTGIGNYSFEQTLNYKIKPVTINPEITLSARSFTYNATRQVPQVSVVYEGSKLVENTDYTLAFADGCTNAGDYSVTVTGTGNYFFSSSFSFHINPAKVSATVVLSCDEFSYTGTTLIPKATVMLNGTKLRAGIDYTPTLPESSVNAGEYELKVTGIQNYRFTATASYTITPAVISPTVTLSKTSYTYNGRKQTPSVSVTYNGTALRANEDYTISYSTSNRINAGTYSITVRGIGNYNFTETASYVIRPQAITPEAVLSASSFEYCGEMQMPTVELSFEGRALTQDKDFSVSYPEESIDAGKYSVTIKGMGNYTFSLDVPYQIEPMKIVPTLKASSKTFMYTGAVQTPALRIIYNGQTLTKNVDYSISLPAGRTAAGSYKITVTGKGNYDFLRTLTYTIEPKAIEPTIKLSATEYVYDGAAHTPSVKVMDGDNVLVKNTDYKVSYSADRVNAGECTATITGIGNYSFSRTVPFIIKTAVVEPVITLSKTSYAYDGKVHTPTVEVVLNGKVLNNGTEYVVSYPSGRTNAGTYRVVVNGIGNYEFSTTLTYRIKAIAITPEIKLSKTSYAYDGKTHTPTVTVTYNGKTLVRNTDYTVGYSSGRINAGSYSVNIKGMGNYTFSETLKYTIKPAVITPNTLVTDTVSYYTGETWYPLISVEYDGDSMVEGEDYIVTYPEESVNAGKYTATVSGTGNYNFTEVIGYTINPESASIRSATPSTTKLKVTMNTTAAALGATAYQIQYRVSGSSAWTTLNTSAQTKTISDLTTGERYQVRVRAYAKTDSGTVYGLWSKAITTSAIK